MWWVLVIIIVCAIDCKSQNLVPNPGFELYIGCPTSWGQLDSTENWYEPTYGTSDYYHTCSNQPGIKVPNISEGFQYPKSGAAFAGILNVNGGREYIAVKLKSALVKDAVYELTCWLNLANDSKYTVSKADIGIYFSKDSVGMPQNFGAQPLPFVPQLVAGSQTEFITDTLNWTELTFQYKASGGERFMVFGLFGDDSEITFLQLKNFGPDVYFYIDDFSMVQTNTLFDLKVVSLIHNSVCFSDSSTVQLLIQNTGIKTLDFTVDTVLFSAKVEVNGAVVQSFDFELSDNNSNPVPGTPLVPDSFMTLEIFPVDLGRLGQLHEITVTSSFKRDEDPNNNQESMELTPILDVGDITVSPLLVCSGGEVQMQAQNYIGEPRWQYSSNGKNWWNLPPSASATHHPKDSTYYRVEICGFITSDSIFVKVKKVGPPKGFSDTICGGFHKLQAVVEPGTGNLVWFSDTNAVQPIHTGFSYSSFFEESQTLFVRTVKDGCASEEFARVELVVEDCPLIIPNIFTPNGDGINDVFYFGNAENKQLHTKIFNRWGEEVASFKGNEGWDGGELPDGVYYYLVRERQGENVKVHKGKVTILR